MLKTEVAEKDSVELSADAIRKQLDLVIQDQAFRSSKRSVQFLRYVVEQTLQGSAGQIKERTIGVEVFGREPSYDTATDHVVRTAAIELRKRLAIYYGEETHRSELRVSLTPGSYVPHFTAPFQLAQTVPEAEGEFASGRLVLPIPFNSEEERRALPLSPEAKALVPARTGLSRAWTTGAVCLCTVILALAAYRWMNPVTAQDLFWKPVLDTPGPVLLAVGDVPNGPPTFAAENQDTEAPLPMVHKASAPSVPFADTVTIARVLGELAAHGKKVVIRREEASTFAELREGPVVLIGSFNNEWSLRLTRKLRYTLALDPQKHLIFIKDAKNPDARTWSWATDRPTDHQGAAAGPVLQDYALISRIWNSETGHVVVVIGGLYTYGTEAAGEFLTDPRLMNAIAKAAPLDSAHRNLQIVLATTVTDDTAGPPRVLAVSAD